MKKTLSFILLCASVMAAAQDLHIVRNFKKCATHEVTEMYRKQNPGAETDQQFESWMGQRKRLRTATPFATVTLPVVFHIVYSNSTDNISEAAIQQQILQLNKDFSNQSNSPYSVAANTQVQFALAKADPSGNILAQPGINRILYSSKGFSAPPYSVGLGGSPNYLDNVIKPATIWDPEKYINIWVLPLADNVLGIATFPASSTLAGLNNAETNTTAGVAVVPASVGSLFTPNGCSPYGKGRTLTHELGHFLGLRHIWGDASCGTDYCEDTPIHQGQNSGVPSHPKANSCGTADEMFENYMDYTDDVVTNTFTADQVTRMQTVLANSPRRKALLTSPVEVVAVSASNRIAFADCSGTLMVTETGASGTSSRYRDYSFTITVEDKATGNATVTVNPAGTAVNGFNYQILTPVLNFASGDQFKAVTVRVFDNALVEGNKTLQLSYSISGSGVTAGPGAQTMTLTILDDDNAAVAQGPVILLSQNWDGAIVGWNTLSTAAFTNQFTVSSNGDAGGTGNVAHITNNTTTRVNQYKNDEAGVAILRSPLINAAGYSNLRLTFKYKVWGEVVGNEAYDYGDLTYAMPAAPSSFAFVNASGVGPYAGTSAITGGTATINLPNGNFANRSFHLGWYWENNESGGNNPGLNVDDIVLTGTGTPVETAVGNSYGYTVQPGGGINNFRSTNNRMIAQLTNASTQVDGVVAAVVAAGNGQAAITTSKGTYQRTQKVFRITPATPVTDAAYRVTLYFTPAELAVWGADQLKLKVLKVKEGVSLTDPINSSEAVVVSPVSVNEDQAAGVIAYTADFTDGFSQYVLVSENFVLPVHLVSFEARPAKKTIELTWKTASEQGNKGFAVERSSNGVDYQAIGWVAGAGTTNAATPYQFTDRQVQPNVMYHYRLRQVDRDNQARYSDIRQARIVAEGSIVSVNPNPVTHTMKLLIAGSTGTVPVSLVNSEGQTVARWQATHAAAGYEVNVTRFSKGYYTVVVHLPGGDQSVRVLFQ